MSSGRSAYRDPDGRDVTPEGSLQRRLLALLVLRRGHLVSIDGGDRGAVADRPPQDRVGALHNHVFRLRRRLGVEVVESTGQGYRLRPSLIDLDLDRLVAALGTPDPMDGAGEAMAEVLARWHGPAYPELDDVDEGRAEAVRCPSCGCAPGRRSPNVVWPAVTPTGSSLN